MTHSRFTNLILGIAGIAVALVCVIAAIRNTNAPPKLFHTPQTATAHTDALMEYISHGSFDAAQQLLSGTPDLGLEQPPKDAVGLLLWNAWLNSISYEFLGDCYPTKTGLARDVQFTALDIAKITQQLGEPAQQLLQERIAQAEDASSIYDENQNYKQSFVDEILCQSAQQILADTPAVLTTTITLQLVFEQGQWRIVADPALLSILSGGITG